MFYKVQASCEAVCMALGDLISGSVLAVAVWFIVGRSSEMKQHGV